MIGSLSLNLVVHQVDGTLGLKGCKSKTFILLNDLLLQIVVKVHSSNLLVVAQIPKRKLCVYFFDTS